MKEILIYNDEGTSARCIQALLLSLRQADAHKTYQMRSVGRSILQKAAWQKTTRLLIFPGGRDIPYHQALSGKANRQISDFVREGGSYLGICAGGYYGSSSVEFEKNHPLEVIQSRELGFFPGIARGPAYGLGTFSYESEKGVKIALLKLNTSHFPIQAATAYYNGGCTFPNAEDFPNIRILARYADLDQQPSAIIECLTGKGCAILSGVHPEYSGYHLKTKDPYLMPLIPALRRDDQQRKILFKALLDRLTLTKES